MKKTITNIALGASILGIAIVSCSKNLKNEMSIYTGVPSQIIPVQRGVEMKAEYANTIAPLIEKYKSTDSANYDATQFAYLDLDSLKKYIAFLDEVQRLNNGKKISGIRFYFGVNQKGAKNDSVVGRETIFMAPTMPVNNPKYKEVYLNNAPFSITPKDPKNKYVGDYKLIEGLLFTKDVQSATPKTMSVAKMASADDDTSLLMDDLYICPPPKK